MQTYYLYDGLGSTTDLVDGSGNSVASYGYDVFGAIRTRTGSSGNYWLFTGEQRDSESDLYYLRARYYDPSIGRFLTRDPFAGWATAPQSQNRYVYVVNNPVRYVDPLGLECSAAPWDWDDCEDDLEEWVEDNVVEPAASAGAELLSDPENVASVVQVVAVAALQALAPVVPSGGTRW